MRPGQQLLPMVYLQSRQPVTVQIPAPVVPAAKHYFVHPGPQYGNIQENGALRPAFADRSSPCNRASQCFWEMESSFLLTPGKPPTYTTLSKATFSLPGI